MTDDNQVPPPFKSKPALERLGRLVGAWQTEIRMPSDPTNLIRGRTTFDWSEDGPFLVERGRVEGDSPEATAFPVSTALIGADDTVDAYSMLYSDSRGVFRLYQMSLSDLEWKLWRDAPGFAQRFTGTFSDNGNTITGAWETSSDGSHWEHDFDLSYTKT